jgi:hypothetical protein
MRIGVFWWETVDTEGERVYRPSELRRGKTEFWKLIATERSVGGLDVPTTHLPKAVELFDIAGAPDSESEGYTHPRPLSGTRG